MLGAADAMPAVRMTCPSGSRRLRLADLPSVQSRLEACLEALVGDNWVF